MPHYLCKLRPPRPTFLADMTPEEAQVMRGHREYWMPRVEIGAVIAMGPVADPAGGYGVAIIEADSAETVGRTTAPWIPWLRFTITPIVPIEQSTAIANEAVAFRDSVG